MSTQLLVPTAENGPVGGHKRMVHKTSTGKWVAVIVDYGTTSLQVSSDGNTWSQVRTIANNLTGSDYIFASSCIAADDSLHLVYRDSDKSVVYYQIPWSTGTNSLGAVGNKHTLWQETSWSGRVLAVDIDCAGINTHRWTVVAVYTSQRNDPTPNVEMVFYAIDDSLDDGTNYAQTIILSGTRRDGTNGDDISIACQKVADGATSNVAFAVTYLADLNGSDQGDGIQTMVFDVTAHSWALGPTKKISSAGKGLGRRRYMIFAPEGDNKFYVAGGTVTDWWYSYSFSWDGVSASLTTVNNESTNTSLHNKVTYTVGGYIGFAYYNKTIYFLGQNTNDALLFLMVTFNSDGTTTWRTHAFTFDVGPGTTYDSPSLITSGGQRHFDPLLTSLIWYTYNRGPGYQNKKSVRSQQLKLANASVVTKPSTGATIATSLPQLEAKFKLALNDSQTYYKMVWQVASDSAFTTNVQTFTQSDDDFVVADDTASAGADVRASLTVASRIASGSWYIRAAAIDTAGNQGAWSAAQAFSVSHPPQASSLAPDNDAIVPFGTGSISFSWSFSDPSPEDYQSGYSIIVTDPATGSTVIDTGFVASTTNGGSVTIPVAYKDKELNWQVTVYDQDGTAASPASVIASFYSSDPPAPTIDSPANGSAITSGRPTVTWSPNLGGTKTQDSFRVKITQGVTTLFDSNWITGTDTTYQVPPGILHNEQNYTVSVTLKDSLGQTGTVSSSFSTSYTPPVAPTHIRTYTYEFNRYGFAYVGWDYAQLDPDFVEWNLYRQEIGQPSPILLASVGEVRPTYGFRDYSAKANTRYTYWVTQVVNRFGDIIESAPGVIGAVTTPAGNYWLLDSVGIAEPVPLYGVTADGWTDEHEEAVLNVLGRGRHVDIGTTYGDNGTLTGQLRDKYMEIMSAGNNWISNAALQYASDGINPDNWTFTPGSGVSGFSSRYDTYLEPAPCAKSSVFMFGVDTAPAGYNNGANAVKIVSSKHNVVDTDWIAGTSKVSLGAWLAQPPDTIQGIEVRLYLTTFDSNGAQISKIGNLATVVDSYEPSTSLDTQKGQWQRYAVQNLALPAGAVTYQLEIWVNGVAALAGANFYIGGASVNTGAAITPYMDGDMRGAGWVTAIGGTSYSTGFYTARQQRLDIEAMKELDRPLFMRSPFGDVLLVSLGDPQNSRQPGIGGGADFNDISLPYREIAY